MGKLLNDLREYHAMHRQASADWYAYKGIILSDPRFASREDILRARDMVDNFEAGSYFGEIEDLTCKGRSLIILIGALIAVLPVILVGHWLAGLLGLADFSAAYAGVLGGTLLILGSAWAIAYNHFMNVIAKLTMKHRVKKLQAWIDKAGREAILDNYQEEFLELTTD